jgi:hypothetical protein
LVAAVPSGPWIPPLTFFSNTGIYCSNDEVGTFCLV